MQLTLENVLKNALVGKIAKADHPITCINPEEYFEIVEAKLDTYSGEVKLYVKGENTCWFNSNMATLIADSWKAL